MRILTGRLRGRTLSFKPNPHLRPTSDKVRKAVFDTIAARVEGTRVLDLFSGTGAMGFEALSLGAEEVIFVEKERAAARVISEGLAKLGLKEKAAVQAIDADSALKKFVEQAARFDIIFLDPPYEAGFLLKTLKNISHAGICRPGALVIAESRKREELPEKTANLERIKIKFYGDTQVTYYRDRST